MANYSATPEERYATARCIGQLVDASRLVGLSMMRHSPSSGVLSSDDGQQFLNSAAHGAALHHAAAVDHLGSFTDLLSLPTSHGPSLASLVRSCLETWGRAWWLISAATHDQAQYRARAMVVKELKAADSRGIVLLTEESMGEAIERATLDRDSVPGAHDESVPGYGALARELLQQCGSSKAEATAAYSHLSGVAHGESIFTESLSEQPHGGIGARSPVSLPSRNLSVYRTQMFAITTMVTTLLIKNWGLPETDGEAFMAAVAQTAACLQTIEK